LNQIDFCIPYVSIGLVYLENLVVNLYKTAAESRRVRILISYHSEGDLLKLKNSIVLKNICNLKLIKVDPYENSMPFSSSANHSKALNALAKESENEIVIFSDSDMAFCVKSWDVTIESLLYGKENKDIVGSCYSNNYTVYPMQNPPPYLQWADKFIHLRYLNLPNLFFFAIRSEILDTVFKKKLTNYDTFIAEGGFPFRLINDLKLSKINNLPIGVIQMCDTGWEIPEIIENNNLSYKILEHKKYEEQNVIQDNSNDKLYDLFKPEVFYLDESPFIAHYRKGSRKMELGLNNFDSFVKDINNYLISQK
jgi:hypothetical protein